MAGRRLVAEPVFTTPEEVGTVITDPGLLEEPAPTIVMDEPQAEIIVESGEESRRVVGELEQEEKVTDLTDEERAQFVILMNCGKRTKTIEVLGHKVGIESLNNDDDLRIGLYTKDFRDSDAYARAVHIGTCAAGIRTIDDRPLYQVISSDESPESIFRAKVEKLLKFYPIAITEIYREILKLDVEFAELAQKLGKLKG